MYRGFEDGAIPFRFSCFKRPEERKKPLVRPYDRYRSFVDEGANGEMSEEDGLLKLTELFQQGYLTADRYLHALRELPSS